jgi:hypothetical protein
MRHQKKRAFLGRKPAHHCSFLLPSQLRVAVVLWCFVAAAGAAATALLSTRVSGSYSAAMRSDIFDRLMLAINLIPTASTLNNFLARLMPPIRNNFLRKKRPQATQALGVWIQLVGCVYRGDQRDHHAAEVHSQKPLRSRTLRISFGTACVSRRSKMRCAE